MSTLVINRLSSVSNEFFAGKDGADKDEDDEPTGEAAAPSSFFVCTSNASTRSAEHGMHDDGALTE